MKKLFWTILLCCLSSHSFSQTCDPQFDPFCEDVDAPIDSGVGLLIGAAAYIGDVHNLSHFISQIFKSASQ